MADACAHDDAVVQADRRLTYRQLDDQAARFAGALTAAGFGHDTKVSLYLYNSPEYLVADRPARATVDERIFDEHGDEQPLQIPRRHGGTWMRSTMNAVSGHGRAAVGAADRDAGGVVSHRGCG
ncbi:MAG: AMP-binding protein [Acidimicrobiales bacterium]|nr:AMP-binding protein [Acidimicrobiales bacterium]